MMETIYGAGILFVTTDKRALFLERSGNGDFVGYYDLPGGKGDPEKALKSALLENVKKRLDFTLLENYLNSPVETPQ